MRMLRSRTFKWSVLTKWVLFIMHSYHTLKYVGSRVGRCYATYLIFKDDIRVLRHSTGKKWHTILTVLWISLKNWITLTCVFRVIILTSLSSVTCKSYHLKNTHVGKTNLWIWTIKCVLVTVNLLIRMQQTGKVKDIVMTHLINLLTNLVSIS